MPPDHVEHRQTEQGNRHKTNERDDGTKDRIHEFFGSHNASSTIVKIADRTNQRDIAITKPPKPTANVPSNRSRMLAPQVFEDRRADQMEQTAQDNEGNAVEEVQEFHLDHRPSGNISAQPTQCKRRQAGEQKQPDAFHFTAFASGRREPPTVARR